MVSPQMPAWLRDTELPVLGICYGMQLQAYALGGRVEGVRHREFGPAVIEVAEPGALLAGPPERMTPRGLSRRIASSGASQGTSSL